MTVSLLEGMDGIAAEQVARGVGWEARLVRAKRGPWLRLWDASGFEFNQLEFSLDGLAAQLAGVRLLHVTDLHIRGKWTRALDELIERVSANVPDVILYGGDQAHSMHHLGPSLPHIQKLVMSLPSRCGAFAVLGNHDGDLLGPRLSEWGVKVITNERVEVSVNGEVVELVGFPGVERRDVDPNYVAALPAKKAGVPRIVLSHYPDLIRYAAAAQPDLYLAGHTHGGQICLPGGFPILRHDSLRRKYCKGVHAYGDVCLMVGRGMGFSSPLQVRAWCPGEVVQIQLQPLTAALSQSQPLTPALSQ